MAAPPRDRPPPAPPQFSYGDVAIYRNVVFQEAFLGQSKPTTDVIAYSSLIGRIYFALSTEIGSLYPDVAGFMTTEEQNKQTRTLGFAPVLGLLRKICMNLTSKRADWVKAMGADAIKHLADLERVLLDGYD